ncbi:MAG TPA: hypothetical protein DCX06_02025 [Opitutae bacterium]|nr:hypothetical protein [Opitutae bacterium]
MPTIKHIRECTATEQQAIFDLYCSSFEYYKVEYDDTKQRALIDTLLQSDWFDALIYFDETTPLAYCFFVKTYTSLHAAMGLRIEEMFVATKFQNQGIGTQLVKHFVQHAETTGVKKLFLDTRTSGDNPFLFYQRLGFKKNKDLIPLIQLTQCD